MYIEGGVPQTYVNSTYMFCILYIYVLYTYIYVLLTYMFLDVLIEHERPD